MQDASGQNHTSQYWMDEVERLILQVNALMNYPLWELQSHR